MNKRNKTLNLRHNPKSSGLVPVFELLDQDPPVRKFVGIKIKKINLDGVDRFQFVEKEEGDVVKYHLEYKKAVKQGVLLPLDEETAKLCGVPWKSKSYSSPSKKRKTGSAVVTSEKEENL